MTQPTRFQRNAPVNYGSEDQQPGKTLAQFVQTKRSHKEVYAHQAMAIRSTAPLVIEHNATLAVRIDEEQTHSQAKRVQAVFSQSSVAAAGMPASSSSSSEQPNQTVWSAQPPENLVYYI